MRRKWTSKEQRVIDGFAALVARGVMLRKDAAVRATALLAPRSLGSVDSRLAETISVYRKELGIPVPTPGLYGQPVVSKPKPSEVEQLGPLKLNLFKE
jgi:hypothetical protein